VAFLTTRFHFLAYDLQFALLFPFVRSAGSHTFGAVTIFDKQRVTLRGSKETASVLSARAFSSEVDTGSREENAIRQRSREVFRCHGVGKCSKRDFLADQQLIVFA
jgi:hypothetical protein